MSLSLKFKNTENYELQLIHLSISLINKNPEDVKTGIYLSFNVENL